VIETGAGKTRGALLLATIAALIMLTPMLWVLRPAFT
jgi:hypothetical protein